MRELLALDMKPGLGFVDALVRAWDAGDAVLPIDQRLPDEAKRKLLQSAKATAVLDSGGRTTLSGEPIETDDALVVATSGSTGIPKSAVLTHAAVAASARITSEALQVDPEADHWLCCLPVAHIGGLSVVTRALLTGTALTVIERFDPDRVREAVATGANLVSLVVATLDRVDTTAFRQVLLGGSAIPSQRPSNTVATYGMTETGSGVVYEGYALKDVELRIVEGEILVRSPTLFSRYREASDPVSADGWFATGDAGELAPDGRLSVSGRLGDVIITGGEKVWPVVVEKALESVDVGVQFAVVGRPDPEWGERVTLVIEDGPSPNLDEVREALRDELPGYALPRSVEVVTALPRTTLGKLRRDQI